MSAEKLRRLTDELNEVRPGDYRRPLPPTTLHCPTCGMRIVAPVPSAAHQMLSRHACLRFAHTRWMLGADAADLDAADLDALSLIVATYVPAALLREVDPPKETT